MTKIRTHIEAALDAQGIALDPPALERVTRWAEEARRHGRRTNLIGTFDPTRIAEELVADSLQVLRLLPDDLCYCIDVGSGAGVPGLILSGARPFRSTLIEPRAKRAMFLRHASRAMGIPDTTTVHTDRLEAFDAGDLHADGPRLWVSRAVFSPDTWLEKTGAYAADGDFCAVWHNDHVRPQDHQTAHGWSLEAHHHYHVPGPGDRSVLLYRWNAE